MQYHWSRQLSRNSLHWVEGRDAFFQFFRVIGSLKLCSIYNSTKIKSRVKIKHFSTVGLMTPGWVWTQVWTHSDVCWTQTLESGLTPTLMNPHVLLAIKFGLCLLTLVTSSIEKQLVGNLVCRDFGLKWLLWFGPTQSFSMIDHKIMFIYVQKWEFPLDSNWGPPTPQCIVHLWHVTRMSLPRQRFRAHMRPPSVT